VRVHVKARQVAAPALVLFMLGANTVALATALAPAEHARFLRLQTARSTASHLAGESILAKLTRAPGNQAPIGGLKVITENGWFAARPSGTEDVYKIYTESFKDRAHLNQIQEEAQAIVGAVFRQADV